ncbi:MAG: SCO family protein [SAR324 cluster bacterium]|nr:SCO family protein [SAR324 cluster bacterium]
MQIRLFFLRILAVSLISASPLLIWGFWRYSQPQTLTLAEAFSGTNNVSVPRPVPSINLYDFIPDWITQDMTSLSANDLRGEILVAGFIYTRCTDTCSLLVLKFKEIEDWMDDRVKHKTQFLLFSMDPDYDTPERLKQYGLPFESPAPQWSFLAGSQENLLKLTEPLNFPIIKNGDQITHATMIGLFDTQGQLKEQIWGNPKPEMVNQKIKELLAQEQL